MSEEVAPQEPIVETIQLHIELPGNNDKVSLELALNETIQEVKQVVSSLPRSRHYTNFSLTYDSFKIEEALSLVELIGAHELEDVKELTLHLREDPYTETAAREHILKVREIIGLDSNPIAITEGVFTGSSKFQNLELNEVKLKEDTKEGSNAKELPADQKLKAVSATEEILKDSALKNHSIQSEFQISPALKALGISVWNPPTSQQALRGDLLYLQAQTLEGDVFQITSHVSGFFVNKSSASNFDGSIKLTSSSNNKSKISKAHSLLELLSHLSPKLVEQIQINTKTLVETQPEVYLPSGNAFLANPWLVNNSSKAKPDLARSQFNYLIGGADGADLTKDWNEEFQSVRELSRESFPERVLREKLLNRTGYEFTSAATKAAISIVRGELQPINPEEDPSLHVFLRNGIFYSFGVDAAEQFKNTGGNEAARAATSRDIQSVRSLNKIDFNGVCHILTTVVDYCGKRVVCQAPVPGIFNNDDSPLEEEENDGKEADKVVYGLTGAGANLVVDEEFKTKFAPIGEAFHLKTHDAWTKESSEAKEIVTSMETKGLKGTDGRDYIIDLYRTTPLDIEFIEKHWTPGHENSYPHREVTLRHEAVEEWWKRQVAVVVRKETEKLEAAEKEGTAKETEDEKPTITIAPNEFALNPDAFALDSTTAPEGAAKDLQDDEDRVREVSKFVTLQLIPEFIEDISSSKSMAPIDGSHLASLLHKRGINIRYLGFIAAEVLKLKEATLSKETSAKAEIAKANEAFAAKKPEKEDEAKKEDDSEEKKEEKKKSNADFTPTISSLDSLYGVVVQEMVSRAVKHVLRDFTSSLPLPLAPSCITHFLNCLLGANVNNSPVAEIEETLKHLYSDVDYSFSRLTPSDVVSLISGEVFIRYRYQLPENWVDTLIRNIPLFREIAKKFGIQWLSRDYAFALEDAEKFAKPAVASVSSSLLSSKHKKKGKKHSSAAPEPTSSETNQIVTFKPEDIIALYPVVKDSIYRSTLVEEIWEAGRLRVQSEEERELGLSLLTEAVQFYEQIYGNIHPQVGRAYSVLGQTYYDLGLTDKACEISRKAVIVLERSLGLDSYDTILALINSAFFEQANDNPADALTIYARVLSDWSIVFGKDHPSVVTTLTNVASLLQEKKLFKEAAAILDQGLSLSDKTNGEVSQISAMLRYQLGQYYLMGEEIELATAEMEKAYNLFKVTVGDEDTMTEDSKKWFEALSSYKARRDEVSAKQELDLKKLEHGTATTKKIKKNGKIVQEQLKLSKLKNTSKGQNTISVPDIANQSVDDILAFIEGQTPSKKKSKNSKK